MKKLFLPTSFKIIVFAFITSFTVFSCKKNLDLTPVPGNQPASPASIAQTSAFFIGQNLQKIPVYNTMEDLIDAADSLSTLTPNQFAQFEEINNFKSMHTCFNEIVNAETAIAQSLEASGVTDVNTLNNTHSNLLSTYEGAYSVKTMSDGGLYLEVNAPFTKLTYVLNVQGFARVGNVLYNITDDTVKTMINGTEVNTSTIRATVNSTANISVVKYEDDIAANTPSFLRLMPQSWKKSGQHTNGRLRNITYQSFNIYEHTNPAGDDRISPFTGTYYKTNMIVTIRSLQRRVFGIWWDNVNAKHALGYDFRGNSITGGFIKNTTSNPFPRWLPYSINWTRSNINGILRNGTHHTTDWNWPSDLSNNYPIGPNPVHAAGNVHRVNASRVQTIVEAIGRSSGVTVTYN